MVACHTLTQPGNVSDSQLRLYVPEVPRASTVRSWGLFPGGGGLILALDGLLGFWAFGD